MPRFAPKSAYATALRARGAAVIAASPTGRYANLDQWLRGFAALGALIGVYAAVLLLPPTVGSYALAVAAGVLTYIAQATFCHDASHYSLSRSRTVNDIAVSVGFAITGVSGALWARRHIHTHHMFPNVAGTDIDADSTSMVRLTPHKAWRPWHRYQAYYAPVLYLFVLAHLAFYEDFLHLRDARRDAPHRFRTWSALAEFAAAKLFHIAVAIAIPLSLIDASATNILIGYALASATTSAMFVVINIGTHIADVASFVDPTKDGSIAHDWATHQAMTAVDWSPESHVAIAITGGANSHAAHHLFPEAAHCHNAALSRVVAATAREYAKPHHVLTFWGMVRSHMGQLIALSEPSVSAERGQGEAATIADLKRAA
jgi:linoleoyl-CoA desaturase